MVDVDDFKQEILVEIEAEKIECTGKVVFSLIMGVICLALAIYLLIITMKMGLLLFIISYLVHHLTS